MANLFLGIEIGGTKLQLVLGDAQAQILERRRFTVDKARGGEGIRAHIAALLPTLIHTFKPVGIGVGFGGPVDSITGQICCSHQIEGWSEFKLGEWLHSLTQLPVRIDNDANVGALGEAVRGAGVGFSPVFYVTLGSGVGGGLVLAGEIYHGAKPGEAEIGHLRLDRHGAIVEARCSGWAVDRRIREARAAAPASALNQIIGDTVGGEARHLAAALQQRDATAHQILRETAEDLALALSHVTHLFHPQVIVLGGGLSLVGEPLRVAVEKALRAFTMEAFAPGPKIALAGLGEDAVPVGALILARAAKG
jgi:glucokinase